MARIVNTFVKGKLNKDLEARLIPNGEYRDARNIQVSKSEGPDVGELENTLGNEKLFDWDDGASRADATCIGYVTDDLNNCAYLFLTEYTDPNPLNFTYTPGNLSQIIKFDAFTNTSTILLQGNYLNFSTTNPIFGANIVENLLFWTDNRNQPRVVNLEKALANPYSSPDPHYTNEDQISVAKYNPYQSITLWQEIGSTGEYETTMKDVTSKVLPNGATFEAAAPSSAGGLSITVDSSTYDGWKESSSGSSLLTAYPNSKVGFLTNNGCLKDDFASLTDIIFTAAVPPTPSQLPTFINISPLPYDVAAGDEVLINPNPYYDCNFAGDPAYLDDKFVRFSYRFRYEDNEYSILAPFTQIAFIPKQDGYFIYKKQNNPNIDKDDMATAYQSTIVEFMENKVDEVKLIIPLPFGADEIRNNLKIKELEIVQKESDGLALRVVDTITVDVIETESGTESFYVFDYLSKKPIKTLPSTEITRVFDKIPVRALAQELSGNRVIYGNYLNKHTPPQTLNYNVSVSDKSDFELNIATATIDEAAPPTTGTTFDITGVTGNIDVGDTAIVGGVDIGTVTVTDGATFITLDQSVTLSNVAITFNPVGPDVNTTSIVEYPNHTLKQNRNYQVGVVLSDRYGRQSSVILSNNKELVTLPSGASFIGDTVYSAYLPDGTEQVSWPGNSLKVLFNDPISPTAKIPQTYYPGLYNNDVSSQNYNPLGWYSYKIVVKQTEQEYYNVYLPGIMAAYPENITLEANQTSHVVLINDNINKVPRDLNEVGPTQRQFRSSVQLFGRVQNTNQLINYEDNVENFIFATNMGQSNEQYYPGRQSDTVSTISTVTDLFDFNPINPPKPNFFPQFYQVNSNPLIAKISTENKIGQTSNTNYEPFACTVTTTVASPGSSTVEVNTIPIPTALVLEPEQFDLVTGANLPEGIVVKNFSIGTGAGGTDELTLEDENGGTFRAILEEGDVLYITPGATNTATRGSLILPGLQYLGIYETSPVISNLDIYWETATSGLISDLNSLVLSESQGGADISSFDTGSWDEGLASGGDILDTEFQIIDLFGVPIDTADPLLTQITVTMSVTDANTPGNNVDNYFNLIQTGVLGDAQILFQVETTSDYYDVVFFEYVAEQRLFNFFFNITTVYDGETTNVQVPVTNRGPGNIAPIITPATSPVTTNRLDTSVLFETRGNNGANNTDLRAQDLTALITALSFDVNGVTTPVNSNDFGLYFNSTSFVDSVTDELVNQISFENSSIPVADYSLTLEYVDAAEASSESYQVILNEVGGLGTGTPEPGIRQIQRTCSGPGSNFPDPYCQIFIDNATDAADNGYYLFHGSFTELTNSSTVITIDKTNASTSVVLNCQVEFFFTNTLGEDFGDLRSIALLSDCSQQVEDCEGYAGDPIDPQWEGLTGSNSIVDTTGYVLEII
tara:strand:+ start:149 stop:4408 length:4260 start_codon:yes stop_codon:yes gene_type:complete